MASPFFSEGDKNIIHDEVEDILSNQLSMGKNVKKFEESFSHRLDVGHAIALNACTSALEAAVSYAATRGKEVIIPAQTFIATGMAVHLSGLKPVFAEISPETMCLDYHDTIQRVNENTAAIIVVHMTGIVTPEINKFRIFCDERNILLIEDAAHTPGAKFKNQEAGTIGHIGCFSFFPSKVLTSGEGGMLTTNDDKIASFARSFQNRGRDMTSSSEIYSIPGRNVRMPEISALLGWIQLSHLNDYLDRRREIASSYISHFEKVAGLKLIKLESIEQSSFWKFPIILDSNLDRNQILNNLHNFGVYADTAYNPPLHLQPVFQSLYGTDTGLLPVTEDILQRHICLPCHPKMTKEECSFVISSLKEAIKDV